MPRLEWIGEEFYGDGTADVVFRSLEQLELHDMPRLLKWSGASAIKAFDSLKSLTIDGCSNLERLPSFPTLTDLIVSNCNEIIVFTLTGFESLLSLLINDVKFGLWYSHDMFYALKKLILHNVVKDHFLWFGLGSGSLMLPALEHLGILHCNKLERVGFVDFSSLKKLHIVNCQDLMVILLPVKCAQLMELVLEDCPQLTHYVCFHLELHSLRKLMFRNCSKLTTNLHIVVGLKKLEYFFISGCPRLEIQFQEISDLISHVPCIIVGNHKANFRPYFKTEELQSLGPPSPNSQEYSKLGKYKIEMEILDEKASVGDHVKGEMKM